MRAAVTPRWWFRRRRRRTVPATTEQHLHAARAAVLDALIEGRGAAERALSALRPGDLAVVASVLAEMCAGREMRFTAEEYQTLTAALTERERRARG